MGSYKLRKMVKVCNTSFKDPTIRSFFWEQLPLFPRFKYKRNKELHQAWAKFRWMATWATLGNTERKFTIIERNEILMNRFHCKSLTDAQVSAKLMDNFAHCFDRATLSEIL